MGKHNTGRKSLEGHDAKLMQKSKDTAAQTRSAPQEPPQKTNAKNQYR